MRITDARVIVTCPGRNFVTLKVTTEDGVFGLGDATLNGRELAVASYLTDHVVPLLIGRDARRIEDTWQYLYKGAYWRRGPVTMAAIAAVDTALWDIKAKAAASRSTSCSAARHATACSCTATPTAPMSPRRSKPWPITSASATRRFACSAGIPGVQGAYGVGKAGAIDVRARREACAARDGLEHGGLQRIRPDALCARARRVRSRTCTSCTTSITG